MAKGGKKRRRRKASPSSPESSTSSSTDDGAEDEQVDDELPDFDLQEDAPTELDAVIDDLASMSVENSSNMNLSMDDPEVLDTMRGRGGRRSDSSTEDLLRDRRLEKFMQFDESSMGPSLPMLDAIGKKKKDTVSSPAPVNTGTQDEAPFFQRELPDFIGNLVLDDETKEVSLQKIVNSGTWGGIFLLILWEVYINSPLFDRAGPMAPVVF